MPKRVKMLSSHIVLDPSHAFSFSRTIFFSVANINNGERWRGESLDYVPF